MIMNVRIRKTTVYQRKADKLLSAEEQGTVDFEVAIDPNRWPVIRGTGGVRKMRARVGAKGKSGGVRACYFYRSHIGTVYLLTLYGKGEQSDLSAADRTVLKALVKRIDDVDLAERSPK